MLCLRAPEGFSPSWWESAVYFMVREHAVPEAAHTLVKHGAESEVSAREQAGLTAGEQAFET